MFNEAACTTLVPASTAQAPATANARAAVDIAAFQGESVSLLLARTIARLLSLARNEGDINRCRENLNVDFFTVMALFCGSNAPEAIAKAVIFQFAEPLRS